MKKSLKHQALAVASLALLTATSRATLIFTDTFDSGTGAWYRQNTTGVAGTQGTLANLGNDELSWTAPTNLDNVTATIGRSFTSTSLAVGQTIRLTFDYRQTGATAEIFRVGLFDVTNAITADNWGNAVGAYKGFTTFVRDNSSAGNRARSETGTGSDDTGTGFFGSGNTNIDPVSDTTTFDLNQNGSVTYQGVYDITRVSASQTDTLFTLSSGVTTHFSIDGSTTTLAHQLTSFDTVAFRVRNFGGTSVALFDNVQIEVIPEPRAALLGGLGLLALLRRRR